jgi:hypothetical protein
MGTQPFGPTSFSYNPGNLTTKGGIKQGLSNQYNINQGLETGQNAQRGSEYGTLMPQYQSLLNSGYSPQEKSAIEAGTTGAISSSYGSAGQAAGRNMAATGNSAGYGSLLSNLARNKGKDVAQQENTNQVNFAQEAMNRKMAGLQGISQLYGVDTSFLNSLGQQQLGVLGVGNSVQSRSRGVLGTIGAGLGLVGL